jgi:endonuclease/exonuclease/phosphatase family metal-dependent hydrolase
LVFLKSDDSETWRPNIPQSGWRRRRIAEEVTPGNFRIATAGATDFEGRTLIDHITVSMGLEISVTGYLPTSKEGTHLSGHSGLVAELHVAD